MQFYKFGRMLFASRVTGQNLLRDACDGHLACIETCCCLQSEPICRASERLQMQNTDVATVLQIKCAYDLPVVYWLPQ